MVDAVDTNYQTRFGREFKIVARSDGLYHIHMEGGAKLAQALQGHYTSVAAAEHMLAVYAAETKNVKPKVK